MHEQLGNFFPRHRIDPLPLVMGKDCTSQIWAAHRAPRQHKCVAATDFAALKEVAGRPDLTICDDRNAVGVVDGSERGPVRGRSVSLSFRARMNCELGDAAGKGIVGDVLKLTIVVEAEANFRGDWDIWRRCISHRFAHLINGGRRAEECRAAS